MDLKRWACIVVVLCFSDFQFVVLYILCFINVEKLACVHGLFEPTLLVEILFERAVTVDSFIRNKCIGHSL